MSYVEFLEAISALAVYAMPDPFTPLHSKVHVFLSNTFLPATQRASKKTKRHRR
jgi:hypothetical protein